MRRTFFAIALLAATAAGTSSASAETIVGAPVTHGPDPAIVAGGPVAKIRAARLVPSDWCGTESPSDNLTNELDNGAFRYHAIYMLPSDAPDRFRSLASGMQSDAFQASSLLESSYGRAIRYDMGTTCGKKYLDISVVRLPQTRAQMTALARSPSGTFDAVTHALDASGFQTIQATDTVEQAAARTRNYVVWLDAPAPPASCGQATIYDDPTRGPWNINNFGGKTAIVFRNGYGFCSSNAVRHEIGHTLGALQPVAPHAFDGAHCNDAYEDTMCYPNAPIVRDGTRGLFFDYRNDDYWSLPGRPLPWWTVDENRFLCPDATCNVVASTTPQRPTTNTSGHPQRHPAVNIQASRHGRGLWRVRVRASGSGQAIVLVRCRRYARGQMRTVFARKARLPQTLRRTVRCGGSRPRASVLPVATS